MTCRTDECNQGRCACPTPDHCADTFPFRPIRYAIGYLSVWLKWRDHAAAKRSGHLASITPREPISGEAKFLIGALICTWAIVAALYRFDSLVLLWPRMVAALSN